MGTKVLIIGTVWAERHASAAGVRMWRLIDVLRSAGYTVVFGSAAQSGSARDELEASGVHTVVTPVNDGAFDEWLQSESPDMVIFDRFMTEEQFSWRVRERCPDAVRILDTIDLHFLRKAREKQPDAPDLGPGNEILLRELAAILRSDLSLVVSLAEMNVLQEMGVPEEKVFYHPLTYPSPSHAPGFNERSDFCTIGNFMHPPNMDAVLRLANELWPKIQQQLPDVALHIYGAYPSERAWQLNETQKGLHIHGSVADLDATLHAHRVLLAPLRFGAGLKGKVMDAWYHGMPVITTPVGAEGLFPSLLWGGSIAETPGDFVDAAVRLFLDAFEWERASARGREILSSQFAIEDHAENLINALQSIDRGTDIWGQMFWREQMRSTEYMSRWIEEKNRG